MKPLDERGERHPKTGSPSKSGLSDAVGMVQPVEKPYSGTLMGTWVGSRAPERPILEPNRGSRAGVGEFFNRLDHSTHSGA